MEISGENTVIKITLTDETDNDMFYRTCKEFPSVLVYGVSNQDCLKNESCNIHVSFAH